MGALDVRYFNVIIIIYNLIIVTINIKLVLKFLADGFIRKYTRI